MNFSLKGALANLAASVLEMSTEDTTIETKNLDMITVKTHPDKPVTMSSNDTAINIPQFLASKTDGNSFFLLIMRYYFLLRCIFYSRNLIPQSSFFHLAYDPCNSLYKYKLDQFDRGRSGRRQLSLRQLSLRQLIL